MNSQKIDSAKWTQANVPEGNKRGSRGSLPLALGEPAGRPLGEPAGRPAGGKK